MLVFRTACTHPPEDTYGCDHDAGVEMALPTDLGSVKAIQDLAGVGRECCEDFGT